MCGITGYIGRKNAAPILIEGLKKLEYRGYDSSGIALLKDGKISVDKKKGFVAETEKLYKANPFYANLGISHTRWATHGKVSDDNAHPHISSCGNFALVHNGVIENYESMRNFLLTKGYTFKSQTDSECLVNLIAYHYEKETADGKDKFFEAVRRALLHVEGTFGIGVLCRFDEEHLVAARRGSPLLIGIGQNERLIASDVLGFAGEATNVIYLEDNQIANITATSCEISTITLENVETVIEEINWEEESAELGEHKHYMLKEIFEQAQSIENAIRGRIADDCSTAKLDGLNMSLQELRNIDRIVFCACGTAWHACLVAEYIIEKYARIPVEVEYASEFRYRNAPLDKDTLIFVLSQSGETIDTLAALRESKRKGFKTLAITNVAGSTISRESDGGLYQYAGREVGVASTKAFTSQLVICALIALYLGRMRDMSFQKGKQFVDDLKALSGQVEEALKTAKQMEKIAKKYASKQDFLFLGRLSQFPIALEGALKLKEISYIHAEGYPAAEMKHGPIALISPECPTVIIATDENILPKVIANAEEIKARKGDIIIITDEPDKFSKDLAQDIVIVPKTNDALSPILTTIPLQLLAYYITLERGNDVDRPRNLAKSVTVE
ncbi:MAG: glutamine--fructose-6-phosphate transaminase (isomerizing) [Opitutales bacterium]